MPSAEPYIAARGISLTLSSRAGPVNILHDVDLTVVQGESVALLGPSGSGKTSLMSLVAGLERPSSGSITIGGTPLNDLSEDALALYRRRNMGIVFQSFHLIPTMTALDNVALPLELAGDRQARERAMGELALVGLKERVEHYPAQLSGGEQQRVAIARALVNDPFVILADEPTGNLDERATRGVFQLLRDINANGTAVVMATHNLDLVRQTYYRTVELQDGVVVFDSAIDEQVAEETAL